MNIDAQAVSTVRPVKESVEDELLARDGVVAVDIGEKVSDGAPTGEVAIIVFVEKKKALSGLTKAQKIPPTIDGVKTDVQELTVELHDGPGLYAAEPLTDGAAYPTLIGGISVGPARHPNAGTLGAMVRDRASGAVSILTNYHVACVDEAWTAGEAVIQPGRFDGGNPATQGFGTLTRGVLSENVDGALVAVDAGRAWVDEVVDIGAVAGSTTATLGMAVQKRGRTTEHTHGEVVSVDATVRVNYGSTIGVRTLRRQLRITPTGGGRFSDRGDSGSVILTGDRRVVGLLFAGATDGSATFANPVAPVLAELGIDLNPPQPAPVTRPIWDCIVEPLSRPRWRCEVGLATRVAVLCPPVTRPLIACPPTRPVICDQVTRPELCQVVTRPELCQIDHTRIRILCEGLQRPPVDLPVPSPYQGLYGGAGWQGEEAGSEETFWAGYLTAMEEVAQDLDDQGPAGGHDPAGSGR